MEKDTDLIHKIGNFKSLSYFLSVFWALALFAFVVSVFVRGDNPFGVGPIVIQFIVFALFVLFSAPLARLTFGYLDFTFSKIFFLGMRIVLIGSILFAALSFIYLKTNESEFLMRYKTELLKMAELEADDLKKHNILDKSGHQLKVESIRSSTLPVIILSDFLRKIVLGSLLSLIIAVLFRKSK